MCGCASVHVCLGSGCIRIHRSCSKCAHCLCKASHLFSWFCFSPPCGLWTLLGNKGNLKNAALPVFPNVQNTAVNLNGASSDTQPCRCCRKPPAGLATSTHLQNHPGGAWAGRGSRAVHCTPTPEPTLGPTWELRTHRGHK